MRKRVIDLKVILLVFSFSLLVSGCGATAPSAGTETQEHSGEEGAQKDTAQDSQKKADEDNAEGKAVRKVIIDTDTGADDSAALILAAKSNNIEIMGVTTLVGNVGLKQSTKNTLAALECTGRRVPVYEGSKETFTNEKIEAFSVFGEDGMGDNNLVHPKGTAEDADAISFIIDTVEKYPGEIEIIALGPATNIAKAIDQAPETMKKVKRIWSMGSAGLGVGNASPVAEFNVYHDAEAYKKVLDFGIPVTIVGLDMCDGDALWTGSQFEELQKTGSIGKFVTESFQKLRDFYKQNGYGDSVMVCDPVAMMCLVQPDFIQDSMSAYGSCITDPGETYGQVIFYEKGFTYDVVENDNDYNVTLIRRVDKKNYFKRYVEAIKE